MYSVLLEDDKCEIAVKGIPRVEKKRLTHEMFKDILFNSIDHKFIQHSILNKKGVMFTTRNVKRGLSNFDDKRFYLNSQESVAYGYPLPISDIEAREEEVEEEESIRVERKGKSSKCNTSDSSKIIMSLWEKRESLTDSNFSANHDTVESC